MGHRCVEQSDGELRTCSGILLVTPAQLGPLNMMPGRTMQIIDLQCTTD